MPMGSRHDEIGLLRWDRGTLILLRDEGGRWRLETGRRAEAMVGPARPHRRHPRRVRPARGLEDRPVLTDWELWAVAATVIRQHCEGVEYFVAERIGALALAADQDGVAAWRQIAHRVARLTAAPPLRADA